MHSGMATWRRDGKELYYVAGDQGVMAVAINNGSAASFEKPRLLFRVPEATPIFPGVLEIGADGNRITVAVPPSQLRQLTVFDRSGKRSSAGYRNLESTSAGHVSRRHSRDEKRSADGNQDIWTIDLATGKEQRSPATHRPRTRPSGLPDGKPSCACRPAMATRAFIVNQPTDPAPNFCFATRLVRAWCSRTGRRTDGFSRSALERSYWFRSIQSGASRTQGHEWLREDYDVAQGRFSPDGRYLASCREADGETMDVYVRPFDAK